MTNARRLNTILNVFRFFYRLYDMVSSISARLDRLESGQVIAQKEYLSKREAAIYLDKTQNYVEILIRSNEIPYYQPSGYAIYIAKKDLDRYITRTRFKSKQEILGQNTIHHKTHT